MARYLSAKEFRQQLPHVAEDLSRWGEIIVLKRSKPLFRVLPFAGQAGDLLDRAAELQDDTAPDLAQISRIVHQVRAGT